MPIIQLINDYRNYKNKNKMHKIKYVKDIIQDLENYGPASLIHIAILSNILKKRINIWNANGNLNKIIGRKKLGPSIDIEYHANNSEQIGHWTLRGSKDPDNVIIDLNSCLFSVIGSQIEQDPLNLRKWTVLKLKKSSQNLAKWLNKIQWKGSAGVFFMIGGVNGRGPESPRTSPEEIRYSERYPADSQVEDAKKILDDSEGEPSEVEGEGPEVIGQSRVMYVVKGRNGGVGAYTKANPCNGISALWTENDQNYVTHRALLSKSGQKALHKLDNAIQYTQKIPFSELVEQGKRFPTGSHWHNGYKIKIDAKIEAVILTLRHQKGQRNVKSAKPFIASIIPILQHFEERRCEETRYPLNNDIRHAKQILDDSHRLRNEFGKKGQSRIRHVVHGKNGGVRAWTRKNRCEEKGAFQTEEDQDYVTHRTLLSRSVQGALHRLAGVSYKDMQNIPISELIERNRTFPKGSLWKNGSQINGLLDIQSVGIVLGHFAGKERDVYAAPFILCVYPNFKKITTTIECPEMPKTQSRYPTNNNIKNAQKILDNSEGKECEINPHMFSDLDPESRKGHSRERHVVKGRNGGVEAYTRKFPCEGRTAFQTEEDQNYVLHRALVSDSGQEALHKLNRSNQIELIVKTEEIKVRHGTFPKGTYWHAGEQKNGLKNITSVQIYLRHHQNKKGEKTAEPHILTMFPILEGIEPIKCTAEEKAKLMREKRARIALAASTSETAVASTSETAVASTSETAVASTSKTAS
ncbi:uncharacterized protein LOC118646179 [Monomorium pharaonis]|uniref:uncharacterized protein LOC118646179 n=1 Tax=Monomorium pharaonis TaxID=307658 RepID=UPI0017464128|nr:uncharacterized protein LOC118646179 [Monomorium pharaonis]